ncbi:hypothetical protein RND71_007227 [Anisodus tanguticus]|uniref:NB-ARC domain-containing protein n=1 Tax=Anisodus tanguticus TaxID=243964 RepID=A0AAE1VIX5_9SOLA|nr:hypothetical protein RND71_007227 [Anisodus tanguticus]
MISIVGMAGIGKTALARNLYNNQAVASQFSFIVWTAVSQTFQRKNILCDLLDNIIDKHTLSIMDVGDLADKLRKHLYGKKYLIIIDDVWHDKVWKTYKAVFQITTIELRVENLFCQKAFREEKCPPMLEAVVREIVTKCGGLPLAIVVIARLLANKEMTVTSWSQFAESMDAHHDDQEALDQFMEDYAIPLKRIILSWIAEGYIKKVENKSLEDVARSYLMDLVDRNLVIIAKKRNPLGYFTCTNGFMTTLPLPRGAGLLTLLAEPSVFILIFAVELIMSVHHVLDDMQTMTTLKCSSRIREVLARTPNLRKLGIYLNEKDSLSFPDFSGLKHLDTLEINWLSFLYNKVPVGIPDPRTFPPNVKKLTLTTGYLDWKDMTNIGLLPNLKVLKVRYNCFSGPVRETSDGGFCNLKFLELCDLGDQTMDFFLQRSISKSRVKISVYHSSKSAEQSAKEIQKLQEEMGASDQLELFIGDNMGWHGM